MSTISSVHFSTLDVVPVRNGGTIAEALTEAVRLAQHVESLDFTRFWLAEHHNINGVASAATAVLVGHVAGTTNQIRVGSGGIMLPNHSPLVVAENFGTLATIYPGRIDLGVGRAPGTDSVTMRALRRGSTDNSVEFPSQVDELRKLLAPARPGQEVVATPGEGTEVPLWILGSGVHGAALAARMGLPFAFAAHIAPSGMNEAIRIYRAQFRPSYHLETPYVLVTVPLVAADTDSEAHYLATTVQQRTLALIRGQGLSMLPPVDDMTALWTPSERETVEHLLSAAIVGGPETVLAGLETLVAKTEADELMLASNIYDPAARLHSYEIVARLRSGIPFRHEPLAA